ncbi:Rossman fold protein, TIGR00730 family [Paenibacillus helianthi]|uniref:Cytokinin riboside 5'-monophosphate phosphoribohydrolase n=1 Tax=Paenibacillus helianthi TaxID=1349432 RepID=A0ABX3EQB1_9BACL|nr:TIGR00730 family Rossman fold protein [Paenibacillus helianthi]OKP87500.1 Rossman fold protein, TIGR00730 family [Paenibacillus helianthi]
MKSIAVFCGSRDGASPVYKESAHALGKALAEHGITLIYGGATVGLMGEVADAALGAGGNVIGVIPHFLKSREIEHKQLTELIVVDSMHERKLKMSELAEGFIALPGGPGTMEEYFEIFTWAQLGLHQKPCGILNVQHYYDPLITLFDQMAQEQFMLEKHRSMVLTDTTPEGMIQQFLSYSPPPVKTYLTDERT